MDVVKEWLLLQAAPFVNAAAEPSLAIGGGFPQEIRIGKGGRVV